MLLSYNIPLPPYNITSFLILLAFSLPSRPRATRRSLVLRRLQPGSLYVGESIQTTLVPAQQSSSSPPSVLQNTGGLTGISTSQAILRRPSFRRFGVIRAARRVEAKEARRISKSSSSSSSSSSIQCSDVSRSLLYICYYFVRTLGYRVSNYRQEVLRLTSRDKDNGSIPNEMQSGELLQLDDFEVVFTGITQLRIGIGESPGRKTNYSRILQKSGTKKIKSQSSLERPSRKQESYI